MPRKISEVNEKLYNELFEFFKFYMKHIQANFVSIPGFDFDSIIQRFQQLSKSQQLVGLK